MKICNTKNLKKDLVINLKSLEKMKKQLEESLKKSLPGKIRICKRKNDKIQYYLRTSNKEKSGKYIGTENSETIKAYVQKEYNERALKKINENIKILEQFEKSIKIAEADIYAVYDSFPEQTRQYIEALDVPDYVVAKEWSEKKYPTNMGWPEEKKYLTDKGDMVRTRIEQEIANSLYAKGIYYRYECLVVLKDGTKYYPDFLILDEVNRKIIIWEHMGLRDNPEYEEKAVEKLNTYFINGFIPGQNLIVTQENATSPLSTELLEKTINAYLGHLIKKQKNR